MDVKSLKNAVREAAVQGGKDARRLRKSDSLRWRYSLAEVRAACSGLQGCIYEIARVAGINCVGVQVNWRDAIIQLESDCNELQADLYRARAELKAATETAKELDRAQAEKLISALKFYGDEKNWKFTRKYLTGGETFYIEPACKTDAGAVAREALRTLRVAESAGERASES